MYNPVWLPPVFVAACKLVLLTPRKADKSRDEVLGQGIATLFGKARKPRRWWANHPKLPSCPGLDASFFCATKRGRCWQEERSKGNRPGKFLGASQTRRGLVTFFVPAAFQTWAWLRCCLELQTNAF